MSSHGQSPASRGPTVPNATASFRLPSGSTTMQRRRERSRSKDVSTYWLGLSPALRSPNAGRTTPNAATQMMRRHIAARRGRQHARALALYAEGSRTPSLLCRPIDHANGSNALKSSAIESIGNALRMTKIRNTFGSSSNTSSHSNSKATSRTSSQTRQRANSEPGPHGTMEAVAVTKSQVP
ncbi:hypothetical protein BU25DRAFT_463398 [Macroventuria anomochaeta]|uniref:Uncharacterized protein n=1 Tax=Macroventuria anomochaeta TaxID=301207 RepID=A0ACB6RKV9_9PLEO|nr:uncharacterized protein BU25DRAFT_463398 [Macroventuria anomochaeta]KAF2621794.1 hypothetical protein BU25DRAFT_463398 [Macroventuria anomochaeta]